MKVCARHEMSDPWIGEVVLLHGGEARESGIRVSEADGAVCVWSWRLLEPRR